MFFLLLFHDNLGKKSHARNANISKCSDGTILCIMLRIAEAAKFKFKPKS